MSNPPTDEEISDWVKSREEHIILLNANIDDLTAHLQGNIDTENEEWKKRMRHLKATGYNQIGRAQAFNDRIKMDQDKKRLQKDQDDHWNPAVLRQKQVSDKLDAALDEASKARSRALREARLKRWIKEVQELIQQLSDDPRKKDEVDELTKEVAGYYSQIQKLNQPCTFVASQFPVKSPELQHPACAVAAEIQSTRLLTKIYSQLM